MRRVLWLAFLGGVVWIVVSRLRHRTGPRATVGYDDGSSVVLESGAPELDRLTLAAETALKA